jgi:hypothetical protein
MVEETNTPFPELRQAWELTLVDFERHPVWIGVHNFDFDKPWYDKSDEATFRPWTGDLPAPTTRGIVLVPATFTLRDNSTYPGYITALNADWDVAPPPRKVFGGGAVHRGKFSERYGGPLAILGRQHPQIFVRGQRFSFWGGFKGVSAEKRQAFYAAIGKSPDAVFPLRFDADPKFAVGILTGQVTGFYRTSLSGEPPQVEL